MVGALWALYRIGSNVEGIILLHGAIEMQPLASKEQPNTFGLLVGSLTTWLASQPASESCLIIGRIYFTVPGLELFFGSLKENWYSRILLKSVISLNVFLDYFITYLDWANSINLLHSLESLFKNPQHSYSVKMLKAHQVPVSSLDHPRKHNPTVLFRNSDFPLEYQPAIVAAVLNVVPFTPGGELEYRRSMIYITLVTLSFSLTFPLLISFQVKGGARKQQFERHEVCQCWFWIGGYEEDEHRKVHGCISYTTLEDLPVSHYLILTLGLPTKIAYGKI